MNKSKSLVTGPAMCLAVGLLTLFSWNIIESSGRQIYMTAEQLIENPEHPTNPKAGRCLRPKEVFRLADKGDEYYFRYIADVKIAPDKSLFILDSQQLLQFSKEGGYLRNYYKKGQGPGELSQAIGFDFAHGQLVVYSFPPQKAVWFDLQGRLVRDVSLSRSGGHLWFYFFQNGAYWFVRDDIPSLTGRTEPVFVQQAVVAVSENGERAENITSYSNKGFAVGSRYAYQDSYGVRYKNRYFIFSNSREYMLHIFDCDTRRASRNVTRKYHRVKRPDNIPQTEIVGVDGKKYRMPGADYLADIQGLFEHKDMIWVMTSTTDAERGTLFDVFNLEGAYVDAYWIKWPGSLISISDDIIFLRERADDGTIAVVGYQIIE